MTLSAFVADKRTKIYAELKSGKKPSEGEFSPETLREALVKGEPQLGTTRFEPTAVVLEFIYPDPHTTATIVPVRVKTPERVLFMPVPEWVVESIWQGEIDGTYHFESEAATLLAAYAKMLDAEENAEWFGPRPNKATGRG